MDAAGDWLPKSLLVRARPCERSVRSGLGVSRVSDCVTTFQAVQLEGCCCAAAAGVDSARQQPSSKGGGGGEAVDACRTGQAAAASLRRRLRAATDAPPFHSAFSPGARERPPLPPFPPPPPRKHGEPRGLKGGKTAPEGHRNVGCGAGR